MVTLSILDGITEAIKGIEDQKCHEATRDCRKLEKIIGS
jgi:hypothetical protein